MLPQAASDHRQAQIRLAVATVLAARRIWSRMGDDFDASWSRLERQITALIVAGQLAAAQLAEPYLVAVLAETNQPDAAVLALRPRGFAGTAADGRSLAGFLVGAVIAAKQARTEMFTNDALAVGGRWLDMATETTIADISRSAVLTGIAVRPQILGYVRSTAGDPCSRCAVLAGKWYRYSTGFLRHPRCHCTMTPSSVELAGGFTEGALERTLKRGRQGPRPDLSSLDLAARSTEGRRMPEQILASTDDRAAAIAMLRIAGFAA